MRRCFSPSVFGGVRGFALLLACAFLLSIAYLAFALPSVSFEPPTLNDSSTTGANWVFVNVTSTEPLNQSLLEWGNSSSYFNRSMLNTSQTNWYYNVTNLSDGAYNYTVWAQNMTGVWNRSGRRFVFVSVPCSSCWVVGLGGSGWESNVYFSNTKHFYYDDTIELDHIVNDYVSLWMGLGNNSVLVDENRTNANDGVLGGGAYLSTNGVEIPSSSAYVRVADSASLDSINLTGKVTLHFWLNSTDYTRRMTPVSRGTSFQPMLWYDINSVRFYLMDSPFGYVTERNLNEVNNFRYKYTFSYNETHGNEWRNGVRLVSDFAVNGNILDYGDLYIGTDGGSMDIGGTISHVYYFNRILNQTEIGHLENDSRRASGTVVSIVKDAQSFVSKNFWTEVRIGGVNASGTWFHGYWNYSNDSIAYQLQDLGNLTPGKEYAVTHARYGSLITVLNTNSASATPKLYGFTLSSGRFGITLDVSSPQNSSYGSRNITISGATNAAANITYSLNGNSNISVCNNCASFNTWNDTAFEGSNNITIYAVNSTDLLDVDAQTIYFTSDTTPPTAVTGLANPSQGTNWIFWNWTNPSADFGHVEVWLNGTFRTNTTANQYNATGLLSNTWYQIQVRSADYVGNVNTSWVNSTAKTDKSAVSILDWYSNATNASGPRDIMFLAGVNDSILFNVTAITDYENLSYVWLVNKIPQAQNSSNFTFTVPACDRVNDAPSCIWEIHLIANDSSGTEAHKEWVVSNLTLSEAPEFFDSFSDGLWQNRIEPDPWGRPLPEWVKNSADILSVDVSRSALTMTNNGLGAFNNRLLLANHTVKKGAWYLKYLVTPKGSFNCYCGRDTVNIRLITGASAPYMSTSNFGITKAFEIEGHTWPSFSVSDNGYLASAIPVVGAWGTSSNQYGSGLWQNFKAIRTQDNHIKIWMSKDNSSNFSGHNDYLDNSLMDDSLLNGSSEPYANSNYMGLMIDTDNESQPYRVYLDDIQIYGDKYYQKKNIYYGQYVDTYSAPVSWWVDDVKRTGIIVDGANVTLSDVYSAINNASLFDYNASSRTGVLYTDLQIGPGAELMLSNETLKIHGNFDWERQIRVKPDAAIFIDNSWVTSDTGYSYAWSFQSEWRNYAVYDGYNINSNVMFMVRNSVLENTGGLYFAGFNSVVLENSSFNQLVPVSQAPKPVDSSVFNGYTGESGPDHALSFRARQAISDITLKNVNISAKAPTSMYFLATDAFAGYSPSIFDPQAHGITLENVVLTNVSILAKKGLIYYWTWYHPTTLNLVNVKLVNSNVSAETDNSRVISKYYLDVAVIDKNSQPLSNMRVVPNNEVDNAIQPDNIENYKIFVGERSYGGGAVGGWDPLSRKKPVYGRTVYSTNTGVSGHTPLPSDTVNTVVLADSMISGEFSILTSASTSLTLFFAQVLDAGSAQNANNYYLSSIGAPAGAVLTSNSNIPQNMTVSLSFSSAMVPGNTYLLNITGLRTQNGTSFGNVSVNFTYTGNGLTAAVWTKTTNYTYSISAYDPNNIWTNVTHTVYPNGTIVQLQPLAQLTSINPDSSWYRPDPNVPTHTLNLTINYTRTNLSVNANQNATNITVNRWNLSQPQGQILVNFTAESVSGNNVNFTVCSLTATKNYTIKNDGSSFASKTADSRGCVWFNNSVWTSHVFTVAEVTSQKFDNDPLTFWVRTDGNDTCSGQNNMSFADNSSACAWRTVTYALATVTAGQTLRVQSGIYFNETATFANSGNATYKITMVGDGHPTLDGMGSQNVAITISNKSYISLSNITIQNYTKGISVCCNVNSLMTNIVIDSLKIRDILNDNGIDVTGGTGNINNITITNNIFSNINGTAYKAAVYIFAYSQYNDISNNVVNHTTGAAGMQLGISDSIINNNTLTDIGYNGLSFGTVTYNNTISNNKLSNCPNRPCLRIDYHGRNGIIRKNKISDAGGFLSYGDNSNYVIDSNIVSNSSFSYFGANDTIISNNIFENDTSVGISSEGAYGSFNVTLHNNTFRNGNTRLIIGKGVTGAPFLGLNNIAIHNNVFYNTSYAFGSIYVEGGRIDAANNITVSNNVFYSPGVGGIYISANNVPLNGLYVKNNIFLNSTYSIYNSTSSNTTVFASYNMVWGNTSLAWSNVVPVNTLYADPLFANASSGDFHLKSQAGRWNGSGWANDTQTSPAIGAGDPASDNSQSPWGGRIEMGAYGNTPEASKPYSPGAPAITAWFNNVTNNNALLVNISETSSIVFNVTVNQTVDYSWFRNGFAVGSNWPNYTYANAQWGVWNVTVFVNNTNGSSSKTWILTVRDIPNINSVIESLDPVPVGSPVSIEANITDLDGDLSGRYLVIDGSWFVMQPNGLDKYLASYTPSSEKVYFYYVYANDSTGLFANSSQYNFTAQQGPAITNVSAFPAVGNESTNFLIQANVTDLNGVDKVFARFVQPSVFELELVNHGLFNATFNTSTPGVYVFFVRANDSLGAVSSSVNRNFSVLDTIPPDITSVSVLPFEKNESTIITISVNVSDFNLSSVYVNVSGPANLSAVLAPVGGGRYANSLGVTPHKPGFYSVRVSAVDGSGNNNSFNTNYSVNDTLPPVLNWVSAVPSVGNVGALVNLSANVSDNGLVDSVFANVSRPDSGSDSFGLSAPNPYASQYSGTSLLGLYSFWVFANDSSGNSLYSFSFPFGAANFSIVDFALPTIGWFNVTPRIVNSSRNVSFSANVTDDSGVLFVVANITRPDSVVIPVVGFSNVSSVYSTNFSGTIVPGFYRVVLVATDIAGNQSSRVSNFTVLDSLAPQISQFLVSDSTPGVGQSVTFTGMSTDNDVVNRLSGWVNITRPDNVSILVPVSEVGYSFVGSPPVSVEVQSEAMYTPSLAGNYSAMLVVRDLANNSANSTLVFEAFDLGSPVLVSISNTAVEGFNVSLNFSVDEASNFSFVYDAGAGWVVVSNSSFGLNRSLVLPGFAAGTSLSYYILFSDASGNPGRYPLVGVENFTVGSLLEFNESVLVLNLSEKQERVLQVRLSNPSSVSVNVSLNGSLPWIIVPSSVYLNPLQSEIVNISLLPDDSNTGDWSVNASVSARGSTTASLLLVLNVFHRVGDGECDSGESCGSADCSPCYSGGGPAGTPASGPVAVGDEKSKSIVFTSSGTVSRIVVSLKNELSSPGLRVGELSSVPVLYPAGVVYRFFNISRRGFADADIFTATIEFRVPTRWIEENAVESIYLARYSNGWVKLDTRLVNSTGTYNTYRASVSGFSYFAVVGEQAAAPAVEAPVVANETPAPVGQNDSSVSSPIGYGPDETPEVSVVSVAKEKSRILTMLLALTALMLGAVAYSQRIRAQ